MLVLPDSPSPLLTRELVYTGITRAKVRLDLTAIAPCWHRRYGKRLSVIPDWRRGWGVIDKGSYCV